MKWKKGKVTILMTSGHQAIIPAELLVGLALHKSCMKDKGPYTLTHAATGIGFIVGMEHDELKAIAEDMAPLYDWTKTDLRNSPPSQWMPGWFKACLSRGRRINPRVFIQ